MSQLNLWYHQKLWGIQGKFLSLLVQHRNVGLMRIRLYNYKGNHREKEKNHVITGKNDKESPVKMEKISSENGQNI
jgi:hypothetical protein